jgi:hypothetical protein
LLKFYKVMAIPTLMYICENWILNRTDRWKIEVTEVKFLKHLADCRLTIQKCTTDNQAELNVYHFGNKIKLAYEIGMDIS